MEPKTAQLRAKPNVISQYGEEVFYETPSRARFLIDTGGFELVNVWTQVNPGPKETKPTGPAEIKKNYSQDAPGGQLIDSQQLRESGLVAESSVSGVGQVLPENNAQPLPKRRGRPPKQRPLP